MRIAFYGSTAEIYGAELDLLRQYLICSQALQPGEVIAATYVDRQDGEPAPLPMPDGSRLDQNGGLENLIAEAFRPGRRFDAVLVYSPRHLAADPGRLLMVLLRLTGAGVPVRVTTATNRSGSSPAADRRRGER